MAEKDLRRMNRTELIEIIYALQKNEQALIKENNKLQKQLDDKLLRIKNAGSIAVMALCCILWAALPFAQAQGLCSLDGEGVHKTK